MKLLSLLILLLSSFVIAPVSAEIAKPNVLFINVDDLRDYGGVYTRALVKLPNLDRLAARGTTFERAYVQYPVCNPSRSSYLTGLRCEQTGIVTNSRRLRDSLPEVMTLPQMFKDAGWQSIAHGKIFHLGGGRDQALKDAWMDLPKSWHEATAFQPTALGKTMVEQRNMTDGKVAWCEWGMTEGGDDDQVDGQNAAATVAMIEKLGARPWFIACGFAKPHDPFIAPKKYFDLYPLESLPIWNDAPDITPTGKAAGVGPTFAEFTDRERREFLRAYCAGASFMDAQLGRVLDALDKNDLWSNTIVVFLGDHGYHHGERGWWNKNTLFERTCRAPLIIAAPGMKGGQKTQSIVEFIDLMPTLAALAGVQPPSGLAGISMTPILADPQASIKQAAYTFITRGGGDYGRRVRTARWGFTLYSDGSTELYDQTTDPEEQHNLSAVKPDLVKEFSALLKTQPAYQPVPEAPQSPKKRKQQAQ